MREWIERLRADVPLTVLALAIAGALALIDFAKGISELVEGLVQSSHPFGPTAYVGAAPGGLSWHVGSRLLTFDGLLRGGIELGVVVGAALLVRRRNEAP